MNGFATGTHLHARPATAAAEQIAYRPDIDGLRAIAISMVLLFHAFPSLFPGGFVGVDVFFVISGFLISGIIQRELEAGHFSYLEFYKRRVRRLLPALLVVLCTTVLVGYALLLPDELRYLGKSLIAAFSFLSNIQAWKEVSYFDADNDVKPLLHLWSLSVEEQFYIFWPVALHLLFLARLRARPCVAAIAALSFAFNLQCVHTGDSVSAFYLPFSRGWELLLGASMIGVRLEQKRIAELASVAGLALIGIAFLVLQPNENFPGIEAIIPVCGAALLLLAGPAATLNRLILSSRISVGIGRISYPLYLWHWPLLAFATIYFGGTEPAWVREGMLVLAIVLSIVTHIAVERPILALKRHAGDFATRHEGRWPLVETGLLAGLVLAGAIGADLFFTGGLPKRFSPETVSYLDYFENRNPETRYWVRNKIPERMRDDCNFYDVEAWRTGHSHTAPRPGIAASCTTPSPVARHVAFLWGDSHAQHLSYGLTRTLPADYALLQVASSGCAPSMDTLHETRPYCARSNRIAVETIRRTRPETVILAQRGDHDLDTFRALALALKGLGVARVIVVGPVPQWKPELYKIVARNFHLAPPLRLADFQRVSVIQANDALTHGLQKREPFIWVDIYHFFCGRVGCRITIDGNIREGLVSADYGHLTPRASELVAERLLAHLVTAGE